MVKELGVFKDLRVKVYAIQVFAVLDGEGEVIPVRRADAVFDDFLPCHIALLAHGSFFVGPVSGDDPYLAIDTLAVSLF